MKHSMKHRVLFIVLIFTLCLAAPVIAGAENHTVQSGEEQQIPAGRPEGTTYKPVEKAADDSSMALVVAGVFGFPVAVWLVSRSVKRSRRTGK